MRPPFALAAGRAAGLVERRGGWRPGQSSSRPGRAGWRRSLAFPVGKIGGAAAAFFGGQKRGYGPAAGSGISVGKIGRRAACSGSPCLPARKRTSAPMLSAPSAPIPSAPRFDPLRLLTWLTPARLTPRKERPGRICRAFWLRDFSSGVPRFLPACRHGCRCKCPAGPAAQG
jgi:hypothetical protein